MPTYYATFGVQYAHEPHPSLPGAHPDGYMLVVAPNENIARALIHAATAGRWAFLYTEQAWVEDKAWTYFPRGALYVLTLTEPMKEVSAVPTPTYDPLDDPEYVDPARDDPSESEVDDDR